MVERDPKCVFVTETPTDADLVVAWLGQQDIPAQVMNPPAPTGPLGMSAWSKSGISSTAIEVWVTNDTDSERAKGLINAQMQAASEAIVSKESLGPIDAVCDGCEKTSTFAAAQRGTVQECPHCMAYLDVPGDEDEFDWSENTDDGDD